MKDSSIKFSIIVPVYNVEKFLRESLDSIVAQTLKDFEVICVNDGSTDNSLEILNEYAKSDFRFKIISQENQGQGVARNNAIDIAQGKYLLFVDPDDFIESNTLEVLYNKFHETDVDIIQFDYATCKEDGTHKRVETFKKRLKKYFNYSIKNNQIFNWHEIKKKNLEKMFLVIWDKAYKTCFIKKYNIRFAPNKIGEDQLFSISSIFSTNKILYVDIPFYHYRMRFGSSLNKVSDENFCVFENIKLLKDFLVTNNLFGEYESSFEKYLSTALCWNYANIPPVSSEKYLNKCRELLSPKDYEMFLNKVKGKLSILERIFSIKNQKINGGKVKYLIILGIRIMIDSIFSLKNKDFHLVISILGARFKFRKKYNLQNNYETVLETLKYKEKIKVVFLVSENQKWAYQGIYNNFAKDERFEPLVLISLLKCVHDGLDKTRMNLDENYNFFKSRGMNVDFCYKNGEYISLEKFEPDIVFYEQIWELPEIYYPQNVSKFALTCYVDYGLALFSNPWNYSKNFHCYLWRFFVDNVLNLKTYQKHNKSARRNCISFGYPKLDVYINSNENEINLNDIWKNADRKRIIYAPHHSFEKGGLNLATFQSNGEFILKFAKQHPETTWVFKPHPRFKSAVISNGLMTGDEIDNYYKEWEKIGNIYAQGNYFDVFKTSDLLITDCCSFLAEYLPTEKPIIRLRNPKAKKFNEFGYRIDNVCYTANNNEELEYFFNKLLNLGIDEKYKSRIDLLPSIIDFNVPSSNKIFNYIKMLTQNQSIK